MLVRSKTASLRAELNVIEDVSKHRRQGDVKGGRSFLILAHRKALELTYGSSGGRHTARSKLTRESAAKAKAGLLIKMHRCPTVDPVAQKRAVRQMSVDARGGSGEPGGGSLMIRKYVDRYVPCFQVDVVRSAHWTVSWIIASIVAGYVAYAKALHPELSIDQAADRADDDEMPACRTGFTSCDHFEDSRAGR